MAIFISGSTICLFIPIDIIDNELQSIFSPFELKCISIMDKIKVRRFYLVCFRHFRYNYLILVLFINWIEKGQELISTKTFKI